MPELPDTPIKWQAILNALDEFRWSRGGQCPPLELHLASDTTWDSSEEHTKWSRTILRSLRQGPGVYLLFHADGTLLYVGKAEKLLDNRMWVNDIEKTQKACFRERPRRWIYVIPIPLEQNDYAPSLERFLINEMNPEANSH